VDASHSCEVATVGAQDWESFVSGASAWLALAELADEITYNLQVRIFRWDAASECVVQPAVAEMSTKAARGLSHALVNGRHLLAIAEMGSDWPGTSYNSKVVWVQ